MSISIKRATVDDIPWLLSELRKFAEFFGTKLSLLGNEAMATHGLEIIIRDHFFAIAHHDTHGPVGFISGVLSPHMFNPDITVLSETFWWVSENHRGTRAGFMLFQEFKKFGAENADWITCNLESHSPVSDEFMVRNGFRLQERSFLMEL